MVGEVGGKGIRVGEKEGKEKALGEDGGGKGKALGEEGGN